MINFFRKLRKSLLDQGKSIKYFKYALGEILLVVIGILIAIQINNWNELNKIKEKEKTYLISLKEDFKKSKLSLDRVIKKTNRVAKTSDTLLYFLRTEGHILSTNQLDSLILSSAGFTVYMPSEGVIKDIIGSGKLDMINNEKLRRKLASWDADLSMTRENEKLSRESVSEYIKHLNRYMDFSNYKYMQPAFLESKRAMLLQDIQMRNFLADIFNNSRLLNELYQEKSNELISLIKLIDNDDKDLKN